MSQKINHPKTFLNYLSSNISLTIMLYLMGVFGLLTIYVNQVLNYSKENVPIYIELKDDANDAMVFAFQKKLQASAFAKAKSVEYVSKEDALENMKDDEFLSKEEVLLFGENILPNMIRFNIDKSHFTEYEGIVSDIEKNEFVSQVFFTEGPAENLASRLYRLEIIVLVLMIFFIFVVITLIKNTLKLQLVANKDRVQTMQLVGSTWDYMSKPYIRQSIKNALLSGGLAIACIWGTRYLLESELSISIQSTITTWTSILSVGILLMGLLLSWLCTRHSVRKYLSKPVEEWKL